MSLYFFFKLHVMLKNSLKITNFKSLHCINNFKTHLCSCLLRKKSCSQSPCYPYPGQEWATRTSGIKRSTWHAQKTGSPRILCASLGNMESNTCAVEPEFQESCHGGTLYIPEVLVACSCHWIRVTRTLGTRLRKLMLINEIWDVHVMT